MASKSKPIRNDVAKAIDRAWPDGVVDMPLDSDGSYFWDIYPKLKRNLSRIKDATLLFEREPDKEPEWSDGEDADEDLPDWDGGSRSYHLFFISPTDKSFTIEVESEEPGEEDNLHTVQGRSTIGCSVGVSLIAPFGLTAPSLMDNFDSGSFSEPAIETVLVGRKGNEIDPDDHYKQLLGPKRWVILEKLRREASAILEKHAITVLPEEELRKTVPRLRGGAEALVGKMGELITVQDALFFEGI
jgi:hypothetical protein